MEAYHPDACREELAQAIGERTLVVSVQDMEGQQTYETRQVFRVQ